MFVSLYILMNIHVLVFINQKTHLTQQFNSGIDNSRQYHSTVKLDLTVTPMEKTQQQI